MLMRPRTRSCRATLDELVAEGARRMLAAALEAEVDAYVSSLVDEVDEHGRRLVVRNGHAEPRSLVTGAGPLEVRAPRVNDRRVDEVTGERMRFRSSILPPWARKSPKVAEVLPLMYLHGMSSGDFAPALEEFFGSAAGLSASVITRLTTDWQTRAGPVRPPIAEGRRLRLRVRRRDPLQRPPGRGPAVCPGHRGCAQPTGPRSWSRSPTGTASRPSPGPTCCGACKRRGMTAPVLAVGDGALGFWGALGEVFPDTVHQRCWVHKMANVMNALPKSAQPAARAALQEVRDAEDREHAEKALERFVKDYEAKWPKAVGEGHQGPRGTAGVLRLPGRALDPPEDHQPDRVHLRHRASAHQGDQGTGLTSRRSGHGLQADRVGPDPLAGGQRTAPRRAGPCRREVREGGDGRAIRGAERGGRRVVRSGFSSTGLDYFSARNGAAAALCVADQGRIQGVIATALS